MKTLYLLYCILFKEISIMQIDEDLDGKIIKWAVLDTPQDGYGGHNGGNWVEGPTSKEAVWNLRLLNKQ